MSTLTGHTHTHDNKQGLITEKKKKKKTSKALFLTCWLGFHTSHLNHRTRTSSHHLALINKCGSTGPGSAKKEKKKKSSFDSTPQHGFISNNTPLPSSLPSVATSPSHHPPPPSNFLLYISSFIYQTGVDPVLIDERTH